MANCRNCREGLKLCSICVLLFIFFFIPTAHAQEYPIIENPYVVAINPVVIEHPKAGGGLFVNGNCVRFARSARPDLPQNLWTLEDKKSMATVKIPYEGAVAVTEESPAGHLSIVRKIEKDYLLIQESGYSKGVTYRWIPMSFPVGFY